MMFECGISILAVAPGRNLASAARPSRHGSGDCPRAALHPGAIEFVGYKERTYKLYARYWIDDIGAASRQIDNASL